MIRRILKLLLIALVLQAVLAVAGGAYVYFHPDSVPEAISSKVQGIVDQGIEQYEDKRKAMELARERKKIVASEAQVTLLLRNGGIVQGELIGETEKDVTVRWEYGDAVFLQSEIAEIRKGREGDSQDFLVPTFAGSARKQE